MGMDSSPGYPASLCDSSGFRWTNPAETFNVEWMSATAARGRARRPATATHRHPHSERPSREELQQQVEQQQREIERLRDQLAEREKQIADAEKQIADLERQLALRKRNSTNSSKPPASDGLAGEQRARGRKHKSKRKPGAQPVTSTLHTFGEAFRRSSQAAPGASQ